MAKLYQFLAIILTCYRVVSEGPSAIADEATILIIATLSLMPPGPPPGFKRITRRPRRPRK